MNPTPYPSAAGTTAKRLKRTSCAMSSKTPGTPGACTYASTVATMPTTRPIDSPTRPSIPLIDLTFIVRNTPQLIVSSTLAIQLASTTRSYRLPPPWSITLLHKPASNTDYLYDNPTPSIASPNQSVQARLAFVLDSSAFLAARDEATDLCPIHASVRNPYHLAYTSHACPCNSPRQLNSHYSTLHCIAPRTDNRILR
jgi:hypothetical protein